MEEKSDDDASFQADEVSHGSEEEPEQRRPKKKKRTTAGRPKGATRRQWPKDQEKALRKEFRKEMMKGRLPEVSSCTKVARYQGQSEEYAGQRCQKMKTVGNFKDFQFKTFLLLGNGIYIDNFYIL